MKLKKEEEVFATHLPQSVFCFLRMRLLLIA